LFSSFTAKTNNRAYVEMLEVRQELPAFQAQHRVMEAIHSSQVVIVSGATGEQ
jgi:HrpA-like RNA helicase